MDDQDVERMKRRAWRAMRMRGYSARTVQAYGYWINGFLARQRDRHPAALGPAEVTAFLTELVNDGRLGSSSQGQATGALRFFYKEVLKRPIERSTVARRPGRKRMPVVLTHREVRQVLRRMSGVDQLIAAILYGSGLRLMECLQLRVKDLDLERREITVRSGKGAKDRVTMLPAKLVVRLESHLAEVRRLHDRDLRRGRGRVDLPGALDRKYPNAMREYRWQYVFPATRLVIMTQYDHPVRHHRHQTAPQRAVRRAATDAGITKRVTCHTFRHSFATHLLRSGYDIRTIQELLGHRSVRTTMIYTHVLNRGGGGVRSPLDM